MAMIFEGEGVDPQRLLAIYGDKASAVDQAEKWALPGCPMTVVVQDIVEGWQTRITVTKEPIK